MLSTIVFLVVGLSTRDRHYFLVVDRNRIHRPGWMSQLGGWLHRYTAK